MVEVELALKGSEAHPLLTQRHGRDQEQDSPEQYLTSRRKSLLLSELDTTPPNGTPVPSEPSPQPQSHEQSPNSEEHGHIRDWHDGYKPARRQKKKPRPGESTFRVPMSMEQRKSLGVSVRPKEPQGLGISNSQPVDAENLFVTESPITPVTRGGTKLKFRAYGPAPLTTNSGYGGAVQLSPGPLSIQQIGMLEQQGNHYYRHPQMNRHVYDIDLLSAPLENGPKLAWWLAQQISHVNLWQAQNNTISPVPEIPASQFYGHDASGHDKRRQTDRERKARWREANAEKNRDNDLRARVKRQAKARFGELETPEMNEWIVTEVAKRKARRADRQISQAAKSGHFPVFGNSENVRNSLLRENTVYMLHPAVHQVRLLIVDILFPSRERTDNPHRYEPIRSLSELLSLRQPQDDDLIRAAFTSIAQDELASNAIGSLMMQFETEDDEEADYEGLPLTLGHSKQPVADQAELVQPNQVFTILNQTLTILTELKELGDKQQAILTKSSDMNGSTRPPSQQEHRQYLKDFGMSELQLEDFLVLVNGGPLEPDPDDDLAVELHGNDLDVKLAAPPKVEITKISNSASDSVTWDTINLVLEALLQRCVLPSKRGRRTKKLAMDENHAKNQAAKVKALLTEIEIGGNRVRSRVESQAISEFYSRLTNFGETQSFGGSLSQPKPPYQQAAPVRTDILPESKAGRKRKYADQASPISQSPAAAMPLPNATNPFADDVMVISPPTVKPSFSPIPGINNKLIQARPTHSPTILRRTLPPPTPIEPQIQSYTAYPQFKHV